MNLGVITYDTPHLKTEQLVMSYIRDTAIDSVSLFALPFKPRKPREVSFEHRPVQSVAVHSRQLAALPKVSFTPWDGNQLINENIDLFIIAGAGILDISFAQGTPILNAHPGIIPTTRGLDSFKWAILDNDPVGITLHLIDKEVDKGEIIYIEETPVFTSDTIHSLARRHYELEINLMSNAPHFINNRVKELTQEKPAKMRMPKEQEQQMLLNFDSWKERYALK
ncbi:formyltransferase family protein [Alteromonas facilis]|uniref:formyltransferase family protein n=1 Tax=Alteromonas facilis TaxID=2048004 RepID=UPI000C286122|nr:formyltransferase family protein [Alteromonas facilis]